MEQCFWGGRIGTLYQLQLGIKRVGIGNKNTEVALKSNDFVILYIYILVDDLAGCLRIGRVAWF